MEAPPPLTTTSKVSTHSIQRAVKSLLKWNSKSSSSSTSDEFLYLVLTLNKIPPNFRPPNSPIKIPLPNPIFSPYDSNFPICLFVEDRFSLSSKKKIDDDNLPINNVIKLSKFRSDFKSFEDKKKLCDNYDLFLADKSVISNLPRLIGRCFYKRKKCPIGIELGRSDWKEQIEGVCGSVILDLNNLGNCVVIRVSRVSIGIDEIVENVVAAINGVAMVVPKKWKNVRAFHLKLSESIALPVYELGVRRGEDEEGKKRMMKKVSMLKEEEKGLEMKNSKKRKSMA